MVPQIKVENVRKVCQLTGEFDRERHLPAFNRTQSRFGLFGTDLGSTFEHEGKLWFLFGDTWPTPFSQCGGVAAVSRSKEHMEVWGVDENGLVRSFWYWNGWQDSYVLRRRPGFAQCAGIASVSRGQQHMEIFAVGDDGALEGKWFWEDEWKDWYTLQGGKFSQTAGIAAVSRNSQHMEIFVVGEDGFIRGKSFWNDEWKGWYTFDGPRLSQTAGLAAVSRDPHHMELFVIGEDGIIRGKWFWDGWKDWYELGGGQFSHTAGIAAVSRSPEHMEIFVVGQDGLMRGKWFWKDEWKDWYLLDKRRLEGPPVKFSQTARVAAVFRQPNHMELFAVALDGRLWNNSFNERWCGWEIVEMCSDSVAWTDSEQPEPGMRLNFLSNDDLFRSPRITGPSGEAIKTGCLEVPIAGLSSGDNIYVLYSTNAFFENTWNMGRSVFCRALGGDPTNLKYLYDLSDVRKDGRFINVAFAVVDGPVPGLETTGSILLAWGSGGYRKSDVYLGAISLSKVEDRDAWKFCTNDVGPTWDQHESHAKGLLSENQVGELSVSWLAPINAWLMLYNAGSPRGILARVAREPWGPWSEPSVLFDPRSNGLGYGHFMHDPAGGDLLSDPGREHEFGGEYGPYVINRYTKALEKEGTNQKVAFYFVLSTWNPYNTVLMQAVISLSP